MSNTCKQHIFPQYIYIYDIQSYIYNQPNQHGDGKGSESSCWNPKGIAMAWLPRNDSGHVEADDFRNVLELLYRPSETTLKSTNTIRYLYFGLHFFFSKEDLWGHQKPPRPFSPMKSATNSPWKRLRWRGSASLREVSWSWSVAWGVTPRKINMSSKKGPSQKGHESSSNHQFSGDMFVFWWFFGG